MPKYSFSGPQSFKQSTFLTMAVGCLCGGLVVGLAWVAAAAAGAAQAGHLRASGGDNRYRGYQHWHQNQTLSVKTLVETPFARAQMHTVKLESGEVVRDWLWFDEGDAVNVLVELAPAAAHREPAYLVFEQQKYGFAGTSLAPVGGFIEPGETARDAAQREVREETGLAAASVKFLGAYRVAANRGAGVVYTYLARGCAAPAGQAGGQVSPHGLADLEAQRARTLTRRELHAALVDGQFKEVKWTATVALALLQERP